jgi:hypothetical protein
MTITQKRAIETITINFSTTPISISLFRTILQVDKTQNWLFPAAQNTPFNPCRNRHLLLPTLLKLSSIPLTCPQNITSPEPNHY